MIKNLNRRERYALYLGITVVCGFLLIAFVVSPPIEKRKRLANILEAKTRSLQEIQALKTEYDALSGQALLTRRRFADREKNFTLFSFLDRLAGDTGLKNKIVYMKPSSARQQGSPFKTSVVEMKLQGIDLRQLTNYLYRVETSRNMVFIKRLSVAKTDKGEAMISAVLNVETYEL